MSNQRRGSGEINILAMLEGQTGRPLGRRLATLPVALWYGGAGVLACALIGVLVWLAHDTGPETRAHPALVHEAAPEPAPQSAPEAAPPLIAAVASTDPATPATPAVPATPAPESNNPPLIVPPPAPVAPMPVGKSVTPAPRSQPQPQSKPQPQSMTRQTSTAHPTAHASRTAATRAPASPHARRTNGAARVKQAAPEADTDVALISAIIQHGTGPRGAPADACAERPCPATLSDQP